MKNNTFEIEYQQELAIRAAYNAAKEADDTAGMEEARAAIHALWDSINAKGAAYIRIARDYKDARDRENELLDFNNVIWDKDAEALVECMRENGIKQFTFSSGWSSAVETAWLFLQHGCKLEGMIQINGEKNWFGSGEFEQKPAYLFSVC